MKNKRIGFYIIAISLPFALLFLLELILRTSGFGQVYPLFVKSEQLEGYHQPNPELIKRYFAPNASSPAVAPDTFYFKKEKPKNTYRIVTMGGSTMAGFPYGRFASVAGMLKQRFKASHPSSNIEVISVAMSSINSYTLLDISEELIEVNPDLVLIYAGHNEYLGVMGVGSVYASKGGHGANLLFLKLKELRIFQLMQSLVGFFSSGQGDEQASAENQRTVMAQVAKNKAIVFQDEVYLAGINQFQNNLSLILSTFNESKVPVIISSLIANESDLRPFESTSEPQLDIISSQFLDQALQSRIAVKTDDINKANDIKHADYFYGLAKRFESSGDKQNAHDYFIKASDFDLLRFRAPSEFNSIIEKQAKEHDAYFVDTHSFVHAQTGELIGNNLMLEHLHPNSLGYFLLAEAFYQTIIDQIADPSKDSLSPAEYSISQEDALTMSPLTAADSMYADHKIATLVSDYPFSETKQDVPTPLANTKLQGIGLDRINGASWLTTQQSLLKYYQEVQNFERAANVAGTIFDAIPTQSDAARAASLLYLKADMLPMAKYYGLRAKQAKPDNANYQLSYAEILFKLNEIDESLIQLNELLETQPNNERAKQIKAYVVSEMNKSGR